MLWSQVLNNWENGIYPKKPTHIKKPFIWLSSVINSKIDLECKEEFIENKELLKRKEDYSLFLKSPSNLLSAKNKNKKYAIHTKNLNGDCALVIPKPNKNKKPYTSIYYFMKNASSKQQAETWKLVAKVIRKMLKDNDNLWVCALGLGVDYLHIRICNYPKYYDKSPLQHLPSILKKSKKNSKGKSTKKKKTKTKKTKKKK